MRHESTGLFPVPCTKVTVVTQEVVSEENMGEILGVTAFDQHPRINLGDVISVVFFHNSALESSGTVTIWHNKGHAAIRTYSGSLSGEWLEPLRLIVSEEQDDSWTIHGELVTGRLAMDINGARGIYSCGEFYQPGQDLLAVGG